ncbi:hypothetical protein CYY_005902 [Polysphondylium violaceum]|uniref:DUF676 domain-containing protein n=1 Tax=Polysphondylium violaceum TaxID=133409 RepID=A0A8J4UYH8_9MYCE|nr:hypothetical protein CYY_005902 [Polysphondylium violaceum]
MLFGVINVLVYIESLRVIDLLKKGVYNIKIKCYRENDNTVLATPYILRAGTGGTNTRLGETNHNIKDHEILSALNTYSSKKFFVQYVNEFILFGNYFIFQIEIPLHNFYSNNIIIDFDLVFYTTEKEDTVEEKVVSQQKLKIGKPGYGVHQYYPITFSDWYFCLLKTTISTCMIDIVFKHHSIDSNPTIGIQPNSNLYSLSSSTSSLAMLSSSGGSITTSSSLSSSPNGSSNTNSSSMSHPILPTYHSSPNSPILKHRVVSRSSLMSLPIKQQQQQQQPSSPSQHTSLNYSYNDNRVLLDGFFDEFFEKKYPEVISFFVESYYRIGKKYKVLLSLLKQTQLTQLGDIVNIKPLNIPPLDHLMADAAQDSNNNNSKQQQQSPSSLNGSPAISSWKMATTQSGNEGSVLSMKSKRKSFLRSSLDLSSISISSSLSDQQQIPSPHSSSTTREELTEEINHSDKQHKDKDTIDVDASNNSPSSFSSSSSSMFSLSSFSTTSTNTTTTTNNSNSTNNINNHNHQTNGSNFWHSPTKPAAISGKWRKILENFQSLGDQVTRLWSHFAVVYQLVSRESCFKSLISFEKKCIQKWSFRTQKIIHYIQNTEDLLLIDTSPPSSTFLQSNSFFQYKPFKIQTIPIKLDTVYDSQPIFFEHTLKFNNNQNNNYSQFNNKNSDNNSVNNNNVNSNNNSNTKRFMMSITNYPGKHLFVFVHGLSGNSYDLRQFKNYFALHFPHFLYLTCSSIQENTLEDIQEMGEKIAAEVQEYLLDNAMAQITKISFLGHSLGGIVVRSALTSDRLQPYLGKLHTYISLSSPHLGTKFYGGSSLVTPAMWVWQKFTSSTCLKQLMMQDSSTLTDTFIYKLSKTKGLEYFQYVFLISSEQDGYVPYHSARIEIPKELVKDGSIKQNSLTKQMVLNLLEPIQSSENLFRDPSFDRFIRLNVIFEAHKGVDGVIGRSAHIRMLDQTWFMQMFVQLYKSYWEN